MIGGTDIHLPTSAGDLAPEVAVRAIQQSWPQAVVEDAETGQRYDGLWQIPFGKVKELFVYRDEHSADRWDREGAVPELRNTMIHLIHDDDMISLVIDKKDAAMDVVIGAVSSALADAAHRASR
jgi:hypothetical protein